jgi:hypothetical protein
MRIRAPDGCKPELVVELRHAAAWVGAEDRWVVRLNAIRSAGGVVICGNGADRPLLGAERVREERVGHDCDPSLLMDLSD